MFHKMISSFQLYRRPPRYGHKPLKNSKQLVIKVIMSDGWIYVEVSFYVSISTACSINTHIPVHLSISFVDS